MRARKPYVERPVGAVDAGHRQLGFGPVHQRTVIQLKATTQPTQKKHISVNADATGEGGLDHLSEIASVDQRRQQIDRDLSTATQQNQLQ